MSQKIKNCIVSWGGLFLFSSIWIEFFKFVNLPTDVIPLYIVVIIIFVITSLILLIYFKIIKNSVKIYAYAVSAFLFAYAVWFPTPEYSGGIQLLILSFLFTLLTQQFHFKTK